MYVYNILSKSGFFTGVAPREINQTKTREIRITWFYAGGVISDGDRLASGLTPTFRGKKKKRSRHVGIGLFHLNLLIFFFPFSL